MQSIFKTTQPVQSFAKFQMGAPLPKGKFFVTQTLHLVDQDQQIIDARLSPLQLWPDKSIKWISCEGVFAHAKKAHHTIYITDDTHPVEPKRINWVIESDRTLKIETKAGVISLTLNKFHSLRMQDQVNVDCNLDFIDSIANFTSLNTEYDVVYDSQQRPLCCHITQTEIVVIENEAKAKLSAKLSIYYADGSVTSNVSIHNTQAIVAHGGKWDLGNENSLYIKSLALRFNYESKAQSLITDSKNNKQFYDYAQLTQYSSGGINWLSENHKTRENKVELLHKGAKGSISINDQITEFESLRPKPFIQIELDDASVFIQPLHFWQKYPSGIRSSSKRTVVDFADQKSGCEVELQPGEIKSHSIGFTIGQKCSSSQLFLIQSISLQLDNILQSKTIPFLHESLLKHPLQNILCETTKGTNSVDKWFDKREALDEFGWRNFGDLFADHEAANYKGEGIFVSHYNNQYDPLFGFLKLWLLTGEPDYKILADELFDHIVNIDIYNTTLDKPDYNKGLFWHTDHYMAAETASHRTYSRHQPSNVYMDHAGGGGPGSHHCYSTGLAFYYLLTGSHCAKRATLGLCEWMQSVYEGDGTILGLVISAKNANHIKIPFTSKMLLGTGTGVLRNVFTNEYPLDRGTGNYVNVLLDSFEISQQQVYLRHVEYVILNTINAADNISKRRFDNIEETWFYTVFLQAVAKYLSVVSIVHDTSKNKHSSVSNKTVSAVKAAFIHYANWIAENETYYLANTEVLEYPNDTWTGQDLRKIQILLCAYEISQNDTMLQKANVLIDYVYPSLLASDEKNYTRIQSLIMQNYTDLDSIAGHFDGIKSLPSTEIKFKKSNANENYFLRALNFFKQYSIHREIDLLCIKIPAFKKVFRK